MGDERVMNGTSSLLLGPGALQAQSLYNWDFNVFELARLKGGRPLTYVCLALLNDNGLLDGWLLERPVVERYFGRVETMYVPNPYHNNTHAADVTQTSGVIMRSLNDHLRSSSGGGGGSGACKKCNAGSKALKAAAAGLSKLEKFAIIFASAVHDLAHPGVNNQYLRDTFAPMALTYNDRSVNENMHVSLAFKLAAEDPDLNIFAHFSRAEYKLVRQLVLDMVLSTDMDVHFKLLERYAAALAAQPDVRTWSEPEQRSLLFQMLVHLADLANPARPWPLALKWAEMVVTEFLAQGEKEVAAGIPISPPCNVSTVCMPAAQLFFIERFMAPTLEAFRSAAPSFYTLAAAWLADTQAKWGVFKSAGVRFPHKDYPQLAPTAAEQQQQPLRTTLAPCSEPCQHCCAGEGHTQPAGAATAAPAAPQQQPCKLPGEPPQQQQHHHQQQAAQQAAAQAAG